MGDVRCIDEYRLFVHPVLVGGGTPFFPPLDERIVLHLVETRTFGSGAICLRYSAAQSMPLDAPA